MSQQTTIITGFLGAGQEAVANALADRGWRVKIASPLRTPEGTSILAVADAVNLVETAADPDYGALVQAQIAAAGAVVLNRSDLVDPGPASALLGRIARGPVVDGPDALETTPGAHEVGHLDLTTAFRTWTYEGPAAFKADPLDKLLERRPPGLYRLEGVVILGEAGAEVDLAGRFRQIRPAARPAATRLTATGLRGRFDPQDMAVAFGEAVSQSAYRRGIFGWR